RHRKYQHLLASLNYGRPRTRGTLTRREEHLRRRLDIPPAASGSWGSSWSLHVINYKRLALLDLYGRGGGVGRGEPVGVGGGVRRGAGVGRAEPVDVGGGVKRGGGVGRPAAVGNGLGVGPHLPVHG